MKKDISIIIPYYNCAGSLRRLLESIVNEDNGGYQIIVVDDNSTENLEEYANLIKEYPNVKFVKNNSEKKGAGAARNIGLQYAEGDWILFSDSDDYLVKGWSEIVSEYFGSHYDIIYFSPKGYDEEKKQETHIRSQFYQDLIINYESGAKYSDLRIRCLFQVPWSKLFRREFIQNNDIRFDETMHSNDIMFSAKSGILAKDISADSRPIYCVVERNGSLTKNMSEQVFLDRTEIGCRFQAYIRSNINLNEYKAIYPGFIMDLFTVIKRKYHIKCLMTVLNLNRTYGNNMFPNWRYVQAYLRRKIFRSTNNHRQ